MNTEQMKTEITEEIKRMNALAEQIMEQNKHVPKGNLRCATVGNSFQYYNGTKYLGKKKRKLAEEMANRDYNEELLILIREKTARLEKLMKALSYDFNAPEKLYDGLHPGRRRLIKPLLVSKEEFIRQWQEEPYERWEIRDDDMHTNILTAKGERVRSKSEKIIADALYRLGIPYRYEYPLRLIERRKIVTRRPDFIVLDTRTLEEKIIEHLGMMGDELYYRKNMEKIDLYEKNGYLIGRNLILLHETAESPLDTTIMEQYLTEFLL